MFELASRIISRLKRELASIGISPTFQAFEFYKATFKRRNISVLLVASGSVRIPSEGWGAVETIIAETIPTYLQNGIDVGLLNTQNFFEWQKASKVAYDVIICHSDTHLEKVRKNWPDIPLIAVTHYGLAAQPDLWHPSYKRVFSSITRADKVVCLSPAIFDAFRKLMPEEKLIVAGNGSTFTSLASNDKGNVYVVVGKVEERKRQYELWKYAKENGIEIRFVGPVEDPRVSNILAKDVDSRNIFLGPRSRSQLAMELPNFRALILLSQGEADALVLYEAQFAGLEIIVNKESKGCQDSNLPWIHLINSPDQLNEILTHINLNPIDPHEIKEYADAHYRWNIRLMPLLKLIEQVTSNAK